MTDTRPKPTLRAPLLHAFTAQLGLRGDLDLAAALRAILADPNDALPVPPASSWEPDGPDPMTLAALSARARTERGTPWPQPLASDAARYHGDGDRLAWETPAFARQERLTRVAVAATADPAMLGDVVDGITLLCEQSSWCWPAHDDTLQRHGSVLATVTDPYLDLGAGEVVGQLAWIDQLLGDQLDAQYPGVRARIRHEARVRVFEPFTRRRDWHWLGLDGDAHNWNPWIHGNVLVAALRLLDDPTEADERARILALVIEGLDRYVAVLPEDGAIDEGYAYWWNGACRLLEALDLLTSATGGRLDPVPSIRALRETVAFPHRMHLGVGWFVNAADGQAKPSADQPWHSLHRAAVRAGDPDAQRFAASHRRPDSPAVVEAEGLGRVLRGMTDAAWLQARASTPPTPAATWLPSTQMLVARQLEGSSSGLSVAVKGGHNNEHHNHNDVGSFLLASDGVPVIVDAGRPSYDARTFSERRYELWPMQSEWHNVPFVAGRGQPTGREHAATVIDVQTGDAPSLELELAGAYDVAELESWRREVRLDRERAEVRIHDAWRFAQPGPAPAAAAAAPSPAPHAGPALAAPAEPSAPAELWPNAIARDTNRTSPQLSATEAAPAPHAPTPATSPAPDPAAPPAESTSSPAPAAAPAEPAAVAEEPAAGKKLWANAIGRDANRTSPQLSAAEAAGATQLRLLLAGEVALDGDEDSASASANAGPARRGATVTPLAGAPRIRITWDEGVHASLTPIELEDPMLTDVWGPRLVRLDLDVAHRSTLTVTARQEHSTLPLGQTEAVGVTE
uniref:heparinase II/III domain-containing protein n=1 Tax=Pseudoclavibacter sp. RFBI5 TaxID=2080578 RepID=UPI0021578B75|nr:heparinase II/III family protein [Pseudoclavibacter sp. RFBI5]